MDSLEGRVAFIPYQMANDLKKKLQRLFGARSVLNPGFLALNPVQVMDLQGLGTSISKITPVYKW